MADNLHEMMAVLSLERAISRTICTICQQQIKEA